MQMNLFNYEKKAITILKQKGKNYYFAIAHIVRINNLYLNLRQLFQKREP